MRKGFTLSFFLFSQLIAWAQLTVVPIERNVGKTVLPGQPDISSARMQILSPMKLPFWDDFSVSSNTDTLWESAHTVWINSGLAINPPTVNVASFDGLNENGIPYNPTNTQEFGFTDSLVSRRIKMTDVPLLLRNSVFLSFFYQWGGFGEVPDGNDFLRLEFKTNTGVWETIATLLSEDIQQPELFYDTLIRINDNKFYHDDFQFRFRSSGRRSGRYDTWHVDYVYLNRLRTANDNSTPDRSLSTPPGPIFGKYYRVPIRHFFDAREINTTSFIVRNLQDTATVLDYSTQLISTQFHEGSSSSATAYLDLNTPLDGIGGAGTILELSEREVFLATLPDPEDELFFDSTSLAIQLKVNLSISSGDNRPPSDPLSDYEPLFYAPIDFRHNDTLQVQYSLDSLYAYDDGKAEYAAGLTQQGNQVAYRFVLKTSQPDTLIGGLIYYPYTASASPNIVTLMVWSNDNGEPGALLAEQAIPVKREGNSVFTPFDLNPAVIVSDTVFIGWEQGSAGLVRVGLDTSHDSGDQIFINTNGTWVQNDLVVGSLMLRPHFGSGDIVTALPEQVASRVELYPNPNNGEFYLLGTADEIQLISITGQFIDFSSENVGEETLIRTSASNGLYIVRYRSGHRVYAEKIVIRR